jgi:hypothetical protein
MMLWLSRYGFRIAAALLTLGILVVGTFLVIVAVPDMTGASAVVVPTPAPTPGASPRSAMALSPVGIEMPADANCEACHATTSGTIGTKEIPVMAHPLHGWRDCTACHTTGSLVKTAPGHSSLHKDDCLICHKTQDSAGAATTAPIRPEHMGGDKPCTSCHGLDKHAPLPEAMKNRGNNCWVCHNGAEFTYLFEESASPAGQSPSPGPGSPEPGSVGYVLNGDTRP